MSRRRLKKILSGWFGSSKPRAVSPIRAAVIETLEKRQLLSLAPLGTNIEGVFIDDAGGGVPPDANGAVGPDYVLSVVNSQIEIHSKTTGSLVFSDALGDGGFFDGLNPTGTVFDPKALYDQHSDRFLVMALHATSTTSQIFIAVSDDSNPDGTWYLDDINSLITINGNSTFADFPGFAVDDEAIYITANMFEADDDIGGTRLWIIPKSGFYSGSGLTSNVYDPSAAASMANAAFTLQPAHTFGASPGTTGTFLVSSTYIDSGDVFTWSSGSSELLSVIRVDDALGSPTFTNQFINVGNIHNTGVAFPDAPQLDSEIDIETEGPDILNAVWRNNRLYAANTVVPPSGVDAGEATAHWYIIDTTTLASLALQDQGDISGDSDIAPNTHTFFPAIMVDSNGHVGIGFSASAASIHAGAYWTIHRVRDAAGFTEDSRAVAEGEDVYEIVDGSGRNRWGDYSGIALDPEDETTFWVFNEYAQEQDLLGSRWGTRWENFGILNVVGTSGNDTITFSVSGPSLSTTLNGNTTSVTAENVIGISVSGGDGADTITVGSTIDKHSTIFGGNGNDSITGSNNHDSLLGDDGNDTILGGDGHDTILGGAGADSLLGQGHNDVLYGGTGSDTVSGGGGIDTADLSSGTSAATIVLDNTASDNDGDGDGGDRYENDLEIIIGTAFGDTLTSFANPVTFYGGDGNDTITGGSGSITVHGGNGDDQIQGGDAADSLFGDDGDDFIEGGDGNDNIDGGEGHDNVKGGRGRDTVDGGNGDDIFSLGGHTNPFNISLNDLGDDVDGFVGDSTQNNYKNIEIWSFGSGADTFVGGSYSVTVYGGDGNDTLTGSSVADSIDGDGGNDTLNGGSGADTLSGGDGSDTITGGGGADLMNGNAGNDFFHANDSSIDTLNGGAGTDTALDKDTNDVLNSVEN
jgi:Ca2+-binding RTX toxin-like protein